MSKLISQSHTKVDSIPLGRRISEIMKEKGAAFSQQAVANRLGYSVETLRLMLVGKRDIYDYELVNISKVLKISVDRIKQTDSRIASNELRELQKTLSHPVRALELSIQLNNIAIGLSERAISMHQLGVAYFYVHNYDMAHEILLEAHKLAIQINEKYGEEELLYRVILNLVDTYTARKDFASVITLIKEVEDAFKKSPQRLSALNYIRAEMASSLGNLQKAKDYSYQSLDFAIVTDKPTIIARAEINAAHYEFKQQNYGTAKELLEKAIEKLLDDKRTRLIAIKELIKTYIKLGDNKRAKNMIEVNLDVSRENNFHELEAKLLILLSRATNDPQHAMCVIENEKFSKIVRWLACKYLYDLYKRLGDSRMFMKYHVIAEEIMEYNSDILHEEDL